MYFNIPQCRATQTDDADRLWVIRKTKQTMLEFAPMPVRAFTKSFSRS